MENSSPGFMQQSVHYTISPQLAPDGASPIKVAGPATALMGPFRYDLGCQQHAKNSTSTLSDAVEASQPSTSHDIPTQNSVTLEKSSSVELCHHKSYSSLSSALVTGCSSFAKPQTRTCGSPSQKSNCEAGNVLKKSDEICERVTSVRVGDKGEPIPPNSSERENDLEDSKSLGTQNDQLMRKPRKPYTITKSREVWTKEEHARFLTALQMYDRDWKKIEVFIGTKTVLQIRSHAQKHFGKVAKYKTGEYIPPPRPKKRASLPYPRSQSNPPTNALSTSLVISSDMAIDSPDSMEVASGSGSGTSDSGAGSDSGLAQKSQNTTPDSDNIDIGESQKNDPKEYMNYSKTNSVFKLQTQISTIVGEDRGAIYAGDEEGLPSHDTNDFGRQNQDGNAKQEHLQGSVSGNNCNNHKYDDRETTRQENVCQGDLHSQKDTTQALSNDKQLPARRRSSTTIEDEKGPLLKRQTIRRSTISLSKTNTSELEKELEGINQSIDSTVYGMNNSLLVLSNCVDLLSQKKSSEVVQKRRPRGGADQRKFGKALLSPNISSVGKDLGDTGYKKCEVEVTISLESTKKESNANSVLIENNLDSPTVPHVTHFQDSCRDRERGRSLPSERENIGTDEVQADPQRNSDGSGSISDDGMAGLTCSDRPSVSDNGANSSYEGSGSGRSVDICDSGDIEEEPKSSNDGSGDDVCHQCPLSSIISSPIDPKSSVSRENSPNDNVGSKNDSITMRDVLEGGDVQNTSRGEKMIGETSHRSKGANSPKYVSEKRDRPRNRETQSVMKTVPLSKTIAHLINDPEQLQCPTDMKLDISEGHVSKQGEDIHRRDHIRLECDESSLAVTGVDMTATVRLETRGTFQTQ